MNSGPAQQSYNDFGGSLNPLSFFNFHVCFAGDTVLYYYSERLNATVAK